MPTWQLSWEFKEWMNERVFFARFEFYFICLTLADARSRATTSPSSSRAISVKSYPPWWHNRENSLVNNTNYKVRATLCTITQALSAALYFHINVQQQTIVWPPVERMASCCFCLIFFYFVSKSSLTNDEKS